MARRLREEGRVLLRVLVTADGRAGSIEVATSSGSERLDQAALELQKGDLEMARKLALQAHNIGGMQEEARGLLNQIDAESLFLKQRTAKRSFDAAMQALSRKRRQANG